MFEKTSLICWSAYQVFGGMPVIGMVIGLMLVSPALPNAYSVADPGSGVKAVMAFGCIPVVGCQGSVFSAILTAYIGANIWEIPECISIFCRTGRTPRGTALSLGTVH